MTTREKRMTQAEEIAELRRWMREDSAKMMEKLDIFNTNNILAHTCLQKQVSELDKKSATVTAKLGAFVAVISAIVAGAASAAFNVIGG